MRNTIAALFPWFVTSIQRPAGSLRKLGIGRLLGDLVHEDGGPLIHSGSEEQQRSKEVYARISILISY
jgi:hypothetical protein